MTRSTPVDTLQGMDHLILAFSCATPYLNRTFPDGNTPLDHLQHRLDLLGDNSMTVVVPEDFETDHLKHLSSPHDLQVLSGTDAASALRRISESLDSNADNAGDHCIWIDGDAPFFSVPLLFYLYELHRRSWCDYTFGDGYPQGYAIQVVRKDTLEVLASLAESRGLAWSRTTLFDALSVDINAFDIETEAAQDDYALLRCSVTVDTRANYLLCHKLAAHGVVAPQHGPTEPDPFTERFQERDDPLIRSLRENPILRRTAPRYYPVEITEKRSQYPPYQPWRPQDNPRDMTPDDLQAILQAVVLETPEATLAIGYRGEPGMHGELRAIRDVVQQYASFTVLLETSGVGWTIPNLEALRDWTSLDGIIVELDAANSDTYLQLRGPGWDEAHGFIEQCRVSHPDRVYVQATRLVDNEWELQKFFKHWNEIDGTRPLIQKYNDFSGRLPDRRVADLAPLERVPCRRLERELIIRVDGRVTRCYQDIDADVVRGTLPQDSVETLWERGEDDFRRHIQKDYPEMCRKCNEYYVFNA